MRYDVRLVLINITKLFSLIRAIVPCLGLNRDGFVPSFGSLTQRRRRADRLCLGAFTLVMSCGAFASPPGNAVVVGDQSNHSQLNRPFSISRFFGRSEIAAYAQPRVNGVPAAAWQCDRKTTWPDGSLQHAIVSFSATVPANGTITVDFVNSASGSSAGSALTQTQMGNFDAGGGAGSWGADIEVTGSMACAANQLSGNTCAVNAKTMLAAGKWLYWLQGPVVTQVIVEDRTGARSADMGWDSNRSLHPIFVVTFYPGFAGVKIEYILENMWTTALQDQVYTLALKRGPTLGTTAYSKSNFTHIAKSRWRKVYWDGTTPGSVNIDYNFPYMISSKVLPNYDLTKTVSTTAIASEIATFNGGDQGDLGGHAEWIAAINTTGARPDIGPNAGWFTRYLYTFDPGMYPVMLGDGEAGAHLPAHLRESATGKFYDGASAVDAFGRSISRHARPTFFFPLFTYGSTLTADKVTPVGTVTETPWDTGGQAGVVSHQPEPAFIPYLITGDWYWLEELYFYAAYSATNDYSPAAMQWSNLSDSIQERAFAWGMRAFGHAALMAPDGTPEKAYFNERINYNAAIREGVLNLTTGSFYDPSTASPWYYGRYTEAGGSPNPLYFIASMGTTDAAGLIDTMQVGLTSSPWMAMYRYTVLGHLSELGFPVTNLLNTASKNFIHSVLDPAYNSYLSCQYRAPLKLTSGAYLTSWAAMQRYFLSAAITDSTGKFPQSAWPTLPDGYVHLAQAAASFMSGSSDGSLTGSGAYSWLAANVPNQNVLNDTPTWAIVPRSSPCDTNGDGAINIADVEVAINQALGTAACPNTCGIVRVQAVITAVLSGACSLVN